MANTNNLDLGPCSVTWNSVDLGLTQGGVTLTVKDSYADLKADQFGTGRLDAINSGREIKAEVPLAETTIQNLAKILGETVSGSTHYKMTFSNRVGKSLLADAKTLILKPYVDGSATTDENAWFTFTKAGIEADVSLSFTPDGQKVYKTTFHCFPDPDNSFAFGYQGYATAT